MPLFVNVDVYSDGIPSQKVAPAEKNRFAGIDAAFGLKPFAKWSKILPNHRKELGNGWIWKS